jgi:Flp pilus assembly protein CpaB
MRSANVRRRRFPQAAVVSVVIVVFVFGLWMVGILTPSRLGFGRNVSMAGLIPVPVSPLRIPAYTKITRDDLWDLKNHNLSVIYLPKGAVSPEMITNINQILGRVLNHNKEPGYAFTKDDFFPPGTRPGLVAGIPAGKRAMRVDATKVQGLVGLMPGDRFDLVATIPISVATGAQPVQAAGVYGQQLALQNQLTNWQKQATVRVLVQNGMIVEPMSTRQVPVSVNTLTSGLVNREKVVQEIVIGVEPGEVARLTEALAVSAEISCVPRSGRPGEPEDSFTPDLQPWNPFTSLGQAANSPVLQPAGVQQTEDFTASAGNPQRSAREVSDSRAVSQGPLTTIESIAGSKRTMVVAPQQR